MVSEHGLKMMRHDKKGIVERRRLGKGLGLVGVVSLCLGMTAFSALSSAQEQRVFVVHLNGHLRKADLAFVQRIAAKARCGQVGALIVDIDSGSAAFETAKAISDTLLAEDTHTIAFIDKEVSGNSALVALSCSHLAISPDGSIGGPAKTGKERADAVRMRAALGIVARERGRDRDLAEALVEARFAIDDLVKKGESLTLTPEQAIRYGLADLVARDYGDITKHFHLASKPLVHFRPTPWDTVLSVLVNPWISLILLAVGIRLLVVDLLTIKTWGATGTLGCLAIGSSFTAHAVLGAGWIGFCVFFFAVWLMLLETYVLPGIGLAFVSGCIASFLGVYLGMGRCEASGWLAPVAAIAGTYLMVAGFFIHLPKSHGWQLISIRDRTDLMRRSRAEAFEGKRGLAISRLNPYGSVVVDGVRLSVVTDGDAIPEGTPICVTRVEGDTIYVEETEQAPCS
jgi:membrane-bound serine protease (ClpP class)